MDWNYFKYKFLLNKKLVLMYLLLLLLIVFLVFVIVKISAEFVPPTPVTKTTKTVATTTVTSSAPTTTKDPRIKMTYSSYGSGEACQRINDCTGKYHPLCNGFWVCENNKCVWYCWG